VSYTLTVIVPVYNEQEALPGTIKTIGDYLETTFIPTQFLFVDDGSTDSSASIIKHFSSKNPHLDLVHLTHNHGLSTAIKTGFDLCKTPYVGYMDADLQTTPYDFPHLFEHLENSAMVNGIRKNRSDSLFKKLCSRIANTIRRWMINDGIVDTCCPLKIIETKTVQRIPFFKGMHRFIPALVQLAGGKVSQVEVSHSPRVAGTSKFHLMNRSVGPLIDTLAFLWMKKNWIDPDIQVSFKQRKEVPVHE